tara:strand:+ start:7926 stop:9437 length:1512 start_codon:yes stop_codon:yes gene_type:complete
MTLILAIDQGTTNSKALLVNDEGRVLARASRPTGIEYPRPGWVQQDADSIWQSVRGAVEDCLAQMPSETPVAIGISNQRESVVVWDRLTGRPLAPCISWQCTRSTAICEAVKARGLAGAIEQKTGLVVEPMFSASKATWLLDNIDGLRRRAESGDVCIGTVDSWLVWNLTGGGAHVTDASNASRTLLLNIGREAWDDELLEMFAIPSQALAKIVPSNGFFGNTENVAGLPSGIPITGVAGDSHAAMFGHCSYSEGSVKATYGTGSSLMMLSGAQQPRELSRTIAWRIGAEREYALEGNIASTGATLDWFGRFMNDGEAREGPLPIEESHSNGVYLVPAFSGLAAPHWNTEARALLTGMTFGTTAKHVARAAMESIAFQVADVLDVMERAGGKPISELMVDGGASQSDTLMQFQADIIGRPVVRNHCTDLSAFGAALLAGLGSGVWSDTVAIQALPRETDRFLPRMAEDERNSLLGGWHDAINRATIGSLNPMEAPACTGTNSE